MTQHISASETVHQGNNTEKTMESRMATSKVNKMDLKQSHEEQITAIEESFKIANDPEFLKKLKHPKNPKANSEQILFIFPDFEYMLWLYRLVLIMTLGKDFPWKTMKIVGKIETSEFLLKDYQILDRMMIVKDITNINGLETMLQIRIKIQRILNCYLWNATLTKVKQMKKRWFMFLFCQMDIKRRRPTKRFRAPENYGKSRYLKCSYEIPTDEKESQLRLLKKERLRDYEIECIMKKRRRIERNF
ncbi:hypothetical protein C2G38_531746 [Gigaspora rosea]|uniref:Uncharacterized protein n=1 Tax=Gigaspora rosea TaxID=44941 RepID=A0A397VW06_9GLOM|nr:hypothetical protein C2G38_531746 [Gigaspora rosea]